MANNGDQISSKICKDIRKRRERTNYMLLNMMKIQQERALFLSSFLESLQEARESSKKGVAENLVSKITILCMETKVLCPTLYVDTQDE